ncbi:MAG: class I SAM-dependent methyltransferase [Chthoniobacterales bacterium]
MKPLELQATRCPLSGEIGDATEIYPANFEAGALSPEVFSARRLPDRIHYRIVRSNRSGLVRSDPVADPALIQQLYARSSFDYGAEVPCLRKTYRRYLERACARGCARGRLLEIGCGNGFFLDEAQAAGFRDVRGIEPSQQAAHQAAPGLRERIVCDIMRPGLFAADEFDVICMFQVFDHIPAPNELLEECRRVLKPGGFLLALNHNVEACSARLLGERSPIVDIEHTFLYSPATMKRICEANGFAVVEQGTAWNTYSLAYLFRLMPLPNVMKKALLRFLHASALGRWPATVPLGNMYLIGRKGAAEPS